MLIRIPFTEFLGVRFDQHYGETFVYLYKHKKKTIINELHPGVGTLTEHTNITPGRLRSMKKDISEYNKEMADCEDDGMTPLHVRKQKTKKSLKSEVEMFI